MNANNPAYPVIDTDEHRQPYHVYHGLTKRELIAAMCLQGLLANPLTRQERLIGEILTDAYMFADLHLDYAAKEQA